MSFENLPALVLQHFLIVCTALSTLCPPASAAAGSKPDLVFILADDLGYADVGFNGGKEIPTPHLDALAARGAVLESFYVLALCTPTRAAFLTGRYPMRYGLQQGVIRPGEKYGLPLAERTLAVALREAGYTTAITGKWHLGEFNPSYLPTRRGFDIQYGHFFGALDYSTHLREGKRDWYRNDQPSADEGYSTHLISREACRIVREQPRDKPLFLYVPFNAVHGPYHLAPGRETTFPELSGRRREYATMLVEMDRAIGEILAALEETGRRKDTLIFFSSDNGGVGPARNGPLRAGKNTPYEGGHRVAACVAWEGRIASGTRIAEPLHMVDWFPTLAGLAGIPLTPDLQPRALDGLDILPVLTAGAKSPHHAILLHTSPTESALRQGEWKLVIHHAKDGDGEKVELFHLASDPGERTNRAGNEPEKLAELRTRLDEYRQQAVPPRSDPSGMIDRK